MSVQPYRDEKHPERPAGHWLIRVSLGKDPATGRYLRETALICPPGCARGCRPPYPDLTARTKREAQAVEAKLTERLKAERAEAAERSRAYTFARLVDEWLAWLPTDGKASNTVEFYSYVARRHLIPTLGDKLANEITTGQIQRLIDAKRASGLSPVTCGHILTACRRAFNWGALRDDEDGVPIVRYNPAREAQKPTQHKTRVQIPTDAVVLELLRALGQDGNYPWLGVMGFTAAATGARRGELCGLQWQHVDLEGRTLLVAQAVNQFLEVGPTKTHAERVIDLNDAAVTVLRVWHESTLNFVRSIEGDVRELPGHWFVFTDLPGPVPLHPDKVTSALGYAVKRYRKANPDSVLVGQRVWWHGLRHYACASMLLAGEPASKVARVMGHASTQMTWDRYSHVLDSDLRGTVGHLDRVLMPALEAAQRPPDR